MKSLTIKELRKLCQKNEKEIYFTDKYINRKLSIYITKLFIILNISSDTTTFLSLLSALASCYFLLINSWFGLFFSFLLIYMYYELDTVDGELARYYIYTGRKKPSLSGTYFDLLVHFFSTNLMFLFLSFGLYKIYGYSWIILLGTISFLGICGFPNLVCDRIFLEYVGNSVKNNKNINYSNIFHDLNEGEKNIDIINNGTLKQKLFALTKELLIFPGCIITLALVCILDMIFFNSLSSSSLISFRLIYLVLFSVLMLFNTIRKSLYWLKKLKEIR